MCSCFFEASHYGCYIQLNVLIDWSQHAQQRYAVLRTASRVMANPNIWLLTRPQPCDWSTPNLAKSITFVISISMPNFIVISWETAPPRTGETLTLTPMCILVYVYIGLYIYIFFFFRRSSVWTTHPILTHNSSNDADWFKEVPFGGQNDDSLSFGINEPYKLPIFGVSREIPAKTRLLNNFLTVRDTPIV